MEGKSYLLTREGSQLKVTELDGSIPPQEEFEIVFGSMQSLGLPNPLAEFLLGRSIQVGQSIELPQAIASDMLGIGHEFGEVDRFQLELKELASLAGQQCAVFVANINVGGQANSPMDLQVTGTVVILTESCRTLLAELSGPLTMNSVERTSRGNVQYQAQGSMSVAVRSDYGRNSRQ